MTSQKQTKKYYSLPFSQTYVYLYETWSPPFTISPIPRHAVKLTQRIRNPTLRNLTLSLIEVASQKPDLAHFTIAILK
ncbi:hypothetical protein N7449_011682 [Penicillium cf. viridicatum]|uniref:Uncharacterized protein n=1 Tax=Penicillium cf. viridicatum TaxID=2972119 RepID=A0A9W9IMY4_9EURO|nr:hypothetical protein N7449_011682 [Penicillium cf. viridicatum]